MKISWRENDDESAKRKFSRGLAFVASMLLGVSMIEIELNRSRGANAIRHHDMPGSVDNIMSSNQVLRKASKRASQSQACGLGEPIATSTMAELVPKSLEAKVQAAVRSALLVNSTCVPSGAVVLSYVNDAYMPLRAMAVQPEWRCNFLKRFVSVCFGTGDTKRGACISATPLPNVAYRSGHYFHFMWLKWRLMEIAMREAKSVLFVNADVMLLRNPFSRLPAPGNPNGGDILYSLSVGRTCDVPHATYPACPMASAACKMNTGFVYIRNRQTAKAIDDHFKTQVYPVMSRMGGVRLRLCGELQDSTNLIDQLTIIALLTKVKTRSCALPGSMVLADNSLVQGLAQNTTTREPCGLVAIHKTGVPLNSSLATMRAIRSHMTPALCGKHA